MCHKRRQFVSIWRIAVESSARLTKCTGTAHATLAADARFLIDVFLEPRGSFVQCLSTADILVTAGWRRACTVYPTSQTQSHGKRTRHIAFGVTRQKSHRFNRYVMALLHILGYFRFYSSNIRSVVCVVLCGWPVYGGCMVSWQTFTLTGILLRQASWCLVFQYTSPMMCTGVLLM